MPISFRYKRGVGKHYMRVGNRLKKLVPGEIIRCEPHELGNAKDKFDQLEPEPPPPQPKVGLKPVHTGGKWWNVINEATGEKLNEKGLTKAEAYDLAGIPLEKKPEE